MATKKAQDWRRMLPRRLSELQRVAEKQVRKGVDQAIEMLPPAPRKSVKQLQANVDRARHDFRKRSEKLVAEMRKRTEHLAANVQKRIENVVTPLTKGLDVASRAEVERLRRRLEHLEHRIESHSGHSGAAA